MHPNTVSYKRSQIRQLIFTQKQKNPDRAASYRGLPQGNVSIYATMLPSLVCSSHLTGTSKFRTI